MFRREKHEMSLLAKAFRSPRRLGPCLQQARRLRMGGLRGYDKKERVEEELYVKKASGGAGGVVWSLGSSERAKQAALETSRPLPPAPCA